MARAKTAKTVKKTVKAKAPAAKARASSAVRPTVRKKTRVRARKAPAPGPMRHMPFAELQARKQLAERALDDIRLLMADADPIGDPDDFAVRERKAMALFDELNALLPMREPLSDEERERLERELADKPDNDTLRKILLEMARLIDDPTFPAEMRAQVDRSQIEDALRALDEVALLQPIAKQIESLAADLRTPRVHDPTTAALRHEAERMAAKRRS
jgi:hypothetical protein